MVANWAAGRSEGLIDMAVIEANLAEGMQSGVLAGFLPAPVVNLGLDPWIAGGAGALLGLLLGGLAWRSIVRKT